MDEQFWLDRWREGKIGFHEGTVNEFLARHVGRLGASKRILVPLCGKTLDLTFLAGLGHTVVGVEWVEDAARQFFADAAPTVTRQSAHVRYSAGDVTILVGDFFATTPDLVGPMDAIYDRAALIALPPDTRPRYAEQVKRLASPGSPALVITLEYPQDQMSGPPFCVEMAEVQKLYPQAELLEEKPADSPRLRELGISAIERCFLVTL